MKAYVKGIYLYALDTSNCTSLADRLERTSLPLKWKAKWNSIIHRVMAFIPLANCVFKTWVLELGLKTEELKSIHIYFSWAQCVFLFHLSFWYSLKQYFSNFNVGMHTWGSSYNTASYSRGLRWYLRLCISPKWCQCCRSEKPTLWETSLPSTVQTLPPWEIH